jgi:hypothetical protein
MAAVSGQTSQRTGLKIEIPSDTDVQKGNNPKSPKSKPQSPKYRMIKDDNARISFSSVSPPFSPRLLTPKTPSSMDLSISEEDILYMKPKASQPVARIYHFLGLLERGYTREWALINTKAIFDRMTKIYPARCSRVWPDS